MREAGGVQRRRPLVAPPVVQVQVAALVTGVDERAVEPLGMLLECLDNTGVEWDPSKRSVLLAEVLDAAIGQLGMVARCDLRDRDRVEPIRLVADPPDRARRRCRRSWRVEGT